MHDLSPDVFMFSRRYYYKGCAIPEIKMALYLKGHLRFASTNKQIEDFQDIDWLVNLTNY
ncbi:hypothetical protein GCM10027050_18640 [Psychrosphaera aestuarii]